MGLNDMIAFILSNFTISFFVMGIVTASIGQIRRTQANAWSCYFSHFLFFSIGCSFFYNFVMHVFFGKMAAAFIGWADSPFQAEVGFASLGMAVSGFIAAFYHSAPFRFATVIPVVFFLWGAAGGHIFQMVNSGNFAPGNAGIIFWTDILLPVICIIFVLKTTHSNAKKNL